MKQINLTENLYNYMLDVSLKEHPALKLLREDSMNMKLFHMQISPDQAQFMQMLIRLIQAKKVLELGTFTGYSALALALALPEDGHLITCDINEEWTKNARHYWEKANLKSKIELRLAPALKTLTDLIENGEEHTFDFIFIDADKTNYVNYYELAMKLISPSGLIVIDNVFWEGKVIDLKEEGGQTREIRKLNDLLKNDTRVDTSLLPIADGVFLVKPKKEYFITK